MTIEQLREGGNVLFSYPTYANSIESTQRLGRIRDYLNETTGTQRKLAWHCDFGGNATQKFTEVFDSAPFGSTFVIDGIDEFYACNDVNAPIVSASRIPDGVKVIIGVWSEEARRKAESLGYCIVDINWLDNYDSTAFVTNFLRSYGKTLTESDLMKCKGWPLNNRVRALTILLGEIRYLGGESEVRKRLIGLTETQSEVGLFVKVIERIQSKFDQWSPGAVRRMLRALYLSRQGITSYTLARACIGHEGAHLGAHSKDSAIGYLAEIRHSFEGEIYESMTEYFRDNHPVYAFRLANRNFTKSVERNLNLKENELIESHRGLAAELIGQTDPEARGELIWRLLQCKEWTRLERLLLSPAVLLDVCRWDFDLSLTAWKTTDERLGYTMVARLWTKLLRNESVPSIIVKFIEGLGHGELTSRLSPDQIEPEPLFRPFSWAPLAEAMRLSRDPTGAVDPGERHCRNLLDFAERAQNKLELARLRAELAEVCFKLAKYDEARNQYKQAVIDIMAWELDHNRVDSEIMGQIKNYPRQVPARRIQLQRDERILWRRLCYSLGPFFAGVLKSGSWPQTSSKSGKSEEAVLCPSRIALNQ